MISYHVSKGETKIINCENCGKQLTLTCQSGFEKTIHTGYCMECSQKANSSMNYIDKFQNCIWIEQRNACGKIYFDIYDRKQHKVIVTGESKPHWISAMVDAVDKLRQVKEVIKTQ